MKAQIASLLRRFADRLDPKPPPTVYQEYDRTTGTAAANLVTIWKAGD